MKDEKEGVSSPPPLATAPIPIEKIRPSKTNPRRAFDNAALEELAGSIRAHGILQPLLLRPVGEASEVNGHRYELVAGERRLRAAKLAGLETVPALVRELGDKEVLEVQVIENLQRTDLHPLEEAEGYRQLHEKHGYSVDDLAIKVGKSKGYVYARLKLVALPKAAREAFFEGKLNPSTALLVARIPDKNLAEKAAKEIVAPRHGDEPLSYRAALEHVQRNYMLRLSEAPFATADAQLYPQAGSCTTCPKRTGNQSELFSDIKGADVCTDPICFRKKADAAWAARAAAAREAGQKVMIEAEVKKVYPHGNYYSPDYRSGFWELSQTCYEDAKSRTYKQLVGKELIPILARDPEGTVHELVQEKDLKAALRKAGVIKNRDGGGSPASTRAEQEARKKEREKSALVQAVINQAVPLLIEAARKRRVTLELIRLAVRHLGTYNDASVPEKQLAKAGDRELAALLVTGMLDDLGGSWGPPEYSGTFEDLCKLYRIDLKKLEAAVKSDTRKCSSCGCTTLKACPEGCSWVKDDLCSACEKNSGKKKSKVKK